jgi:hypothetical protein
MGLSLFSLTAPLLLSTAAASAQDLTADTGRLVLVLDNGQVWQQLEGGVLRCAPRGKLAQMQVRISRGLFGSYNLQFAGHNVLYKVRRVK